MTTGSRPRFSVRVGLAAVPEHDGPFEDVSEHLLAPLQKWVADTLRGGPRRSYLPAVAHPRAPEPRHHKTQYVRPLARTAGTQLLDVVDETLRTPAADEWQVEVLDQMLDDAGSTYRVNEARDGLEERVTPAVRDAVRQTITDAAAGHATIHPPRMLPSALAHLNHAYVLPELVGSRSTSYCPHRRGSCRGPALGRRHRASHRFLARGERGQCSGSSRLRIGCILGP